MKKTITLNTFRRFEAQQDAMMRAAMPRTAAADSAPLVTEITGQRAVRKTWTLPRAYVAKGPFTFAEVVRG
jgi:hypothetical protein